VGAKPSPDHVRLAGDYLGSVLERGSAVCRPRHLPDTAAPLHPFDAQSRIKVLLGDPADEELQRREKQSALSSIEGRPVPQEPRQLVVGRQRLRGVVCGGRLEVRDELLGAAMRHGLPVGELLIGFTLTGLPRRRPEPRLVGIDRSLDDPAQQYSGTFEGSRWQRVDQVMKLSLGHSQIVAPMEASPSTQLRTAPRAPSRRQPP